MGRHKKVDSSIPKHYQIPTTLAAQVDLLLFSPLEGKIPHGAQSDLVVRLLRDWVAKQQTQDLVCGR